MADTNEDIEFDTDIGRLREHLRRLVRELNVLRAETERVGLTFAQGHALIAIEADSTLSVGDLAAVLRLSPSTTSRLVERLRQKQWVAQQATEGDRRRKVFALTQRGRARVRQLHEQMNRRTREALLQLSPEERETAIRGIGLYVDALERSRDDSRRELGE